MKSFHLYIFSFIILLSSVDVSSLYGAERATADLTVFVTAATSEEILIPNFPVGMSVGTNWRPEVGMLGAMSTLYVKGQTNAKGECILRARSTVTPEPQMIYPKVDGFYNGVFGVASNEKILNNEWQPSPRNVTLYFRPIRNPVPMYIRKVTIIFPTGDGPFGYDLIAHDLVGSGGKGSVPHLMFSMKRVQTSKRPVQNGMYQYKHYNPTIIEMPDPPVDETLIVSAVTGVGRGMLMAKSPESLRNFPITLDFRSEFRWPYETPNEGFVNEVGFQYNTAVDEPNFNARNNEVCFAFVTNNAVGQSLVGRISGGVSFLPPSRVTFSYHFNPDPASRSLEWSENIFKKDDPDNEYAHVKIGEPELPAKKKIQEVGTFSFGPLPSGLEDKIGPIKEGR